MMEMKSMLHRGLALALALLLISPTSLQAATLNAETAGASESRFRDEVNQEMTKKKVDTEIPVTIEEVTPKKELKKKKDGKLPIFRMNDIRIVGNEQVPSDEIEPYVYTLFNRDVNMEEIQEVVSDIKDHYRKAGFISAYVYVPPQQIQNGVVELRIVEGQLADISVAGNRYFSEKIILKNFQGIDSQNVLYDELRKDLNRLNKHPHIQAKAVLSPGAKPGTTAVTVQIDDKLPVKLSTSVNNLGTKNTGRARWGIAGGLTNVTGNLDQLIGRFQIGKGAKAVGAAYELPLQKIKSKIGLSFTRATVDVGGRFRALNLKGNATTYGAYFLKTFLESKHFEGDVKVGFDWKSIENKILGATSSKDEHRILNFALLLNEMDRYGKTFTNQSFHFGFDRFLGASHKNDPRASRVGAGGQFFIYRANLQRYFKLPENSMLAFKFGMQLSEDSLAPSEQFKLGGTFSVRGFPEGEYLADQGALLTTELLIPTFIFPETWSLPWTDQPLREQVQMVGFFDFGGGALRNPLPGEKEHRFLAGVGGGVRIRLYDKVYARAEWGTSVGGESPVTGESSVFYFGVTAELF